MWTIPSVITLSFSELQALDLVTNCLLVWGWGSLLCSGVGHRQLSLFTKKLPQNSHFWLDWVWTVYSYVDIIYNMWQFLNLWTCNFEWKYIFNKENKWGRLEKNWKNFTCRTCFSFYPKIIIRFVIYKLLYVATFISILLWGGGNDSDPNTWPSFHGIL